MDLVIDWHTKQSKLDPPSESNGYLKAHNLHIILVALQHPPLSKHAQQRLLRLHNRSPPDSLLRRDDRWRLRDVLAEDLGPDEPREPDEEFVADELLCRDLEDLCGLC